MQITSTLRPNFVPVRTSAPEAPTPPSAPQEKVTLGQHPSWTQTAFGKASLTVGRNVGLTGGIAAVGALGAQVGRLGVLGVTAGAAALGAYLSQGVTFQDDLSKTQNLAIGASLAAGAALIGIVPSQVGGLQAGMVAAGILGTVGVFRGLMEVASDHGLV